MLGKYTVDTNLSYGSVYDNLLIQDDNREALKALINNNYKVKCIIIDPPYNRKNKFRKYTDNNPNWLEDIKTRLILLWELLLDSGSIWITIDDNEVHYLKVLCDEVFGRDKFIGNIVWQSKNTPANNVNTISQTHNHILVYAKDNFTPNLIPRTEKQLSTYKNPDNDPRGDWLPTPLTRPEFRERDYYGIINPNTAQIIFPPKNSSWRYTKSKIKNLIKDNKVWWGKSGQATFPFQKRFLTDVKQGVVSQTWWDKEFAGHTGLANKELKSIYGSKVFDTPKPELLIYRILQVATTPTDMILDCYGGSGTSGAVAHKMNRKWIMVENGEHCNLIPVRLNKVIDGLDMNGVTKLTGWSSGGGYTYLTIS